MFAAPLTTRAVAASRSGFRGRFASQMTVLSGGLEQIEELFALLANL
jgi:hypothetical protein